MINFVEMTTNDRVCVKPNRFLGIKEICFFEKHFSLLLFLNVDI